MYVNIGKNWFVYSDLEGGCDWLFLCHLVVKCYVLSWTVWLIFFCTLCGILIIDVSDNIFNIYLSVSLA